MSYNLARCYQLYITITENSSSGSKTILLTPPSEETSQPIRTFLSDEDTLDIGLPKTTYLSIFKEAHTFWHNNLVPHAPNFEEYWLDDRNKLLSTYYMTFGYLLTTNENHTILKLHELVFWKLWKTSLDSRRYLISEFELLTVLISSRLKRINKSSSLWLMVKKITIALILQEIPGDNQKDSVELYELLISRVIKSCDVHFANYYASSFLKWCIQVNSIIAKSTKSTCVRSIMVEMNTLILDSIMLLCRLKLSDVSLWTTLEVYFREYNSPSSSGNGGYHCEAKPSTFVIREYNLITEQLITLSNENFTKITTLKKNTMPTFDADGFKRNQIRWLLRANCSVLTPYVALLSPLPASPGGSDLELHNMINLAYEHENKQLNNFGDITGENAMYYSKAKFVNTLHELLLMYNV